MSTMTESGSSAGVKPRLKSVTEPKKRRPLPSVPIRVAQSVSRPQGFCPPQEILATGSGRLLGNGQVEVSDSKTKGVIQAKEIILATGSKPVELPFMPFDGELLRRPRNRFGLHLHVLSLIHI